MKKKQKMQICIQKCLQKSENLLICYVHGDLAQLGEHFLDVEGVMGSSPLASTIKDKKAMDQRFIAFSLSRPDRFDDPEKFAPLFAPSDR